MIPFTQNPTFNLSLNNSPKNEESPSLPDAIAKAFETTNWKVSEIETYFQTFIINMADPVD